MISFVNIIIVYYHFNNCYGNNWTKAKVLSVNRQEYRTQDLSPYKINSIISDLSLLTLSTCSKF